MALACKGKWGASAFPFLIAHAILAFVYYVFVFRFIWGLFDSHEVVVPLILLVLFHIPFVMCQFSYFQCTFTDPGGVPDGFPDEYENKDQVDAEVDSSSFNLVVETNKKGEKRKCEKCVKAKPDRAHHCSSCKRCILKMDHHCPWVNNCVGFYNYKFFILFLTWIVVLSLVVALCLISSVIKFFQLGAGSDFMIVTLFIISLVFGLGLSMFAGTHFVYAFKNQTTIEALEKTSRRKDNPFNIGKYANFKQVFGTNPYLWFVPVFTSLGNGLWYPQKMVLSSDDNDLMV